ncbi:MAG: hypothetical protein Q8K89_12835 [Actinomycetota bacterium]|nr:hypothetical protein [Actinomycetota bacterium]
MTVFPPGICVAKGVWIGRGVEFDWTYGFLIEIRDDVTIAQGARLLCHDASSQSRLGVTWVAPITVCGGAFVGAEALIMPGVTVGEGSVVASRAVVVDDVEPRTVVGGVPARRICTVEELDGRRLAELNRIGCHDRALDTNPAVRFANQRARAQADGGLFVGTTEVAQRYSLRGEGRE